MKLKGKAHKFGRDIDTDIIIPAEYLDTTDPDELAGHCMEGSVKDFKSKVNPGDIIVADENFGCGSSREHAPVAIKAAGISCVIAKSFARIFYRNAFNVGLPVIVFPNASSRIKKGEKIRVDLQSGTLTIIKTGVQIHAEAIPEIMLDFIRQGGAIPRYLSKKK